MINKVTGEHGILIDGKEYILRFDWTALSEIEQAHGANPNLFQPAVVASVAAAGFRRRHPELTVERLLELSPPFWPFAQAVQLALQWAYFGPEAVTDGAKKKPPMIPAGLWRRLSRLFRAG
jgi:hypothetical protein